MDTFRSRDSRVVPLFDLSHTSSPESTPNCTKGLKNQLHTVDWDEFKYRQLHWAPIVEVYTIAVPRNAPHHNFNNEDYSLKKRHIEAWLLQAWISMVSSFNWAPPMTTIITTTGPDYSIRPMRETECDRDIEWNTIPTSQLSAIMSQRSYNGRGTSQAMTMIITSTVFDPIKERNRIAFLRLNWARSSVGEPTVKGASVPMNRQYREPKAKSKDNCESGQLRLHPFELSEVHRLQWACTPTTLATSKKPGGQRKQQRQLD